MCIPNYVLKFIVECQKIPRRQEEKYSSLFSKFNYQICQSQISQFGLDLESFCMFFFFWPAPAHVIIGKNNFSYETSAGTYIDNKLFIVSSIKVKENYLIIARLVKLLDLKQFLIL